MERNNTMGFDLSGESPMINTELSSYKLYGVIESIEDWKEQRNLLDAMTSLDKEQYWNEYESYHADNPGIYFRNNCWWWRPLWDYVCTNCADIITIKDVNGGNYNDGHKISKTKAKKISKKLYSLIAKGDVKKFEVEYEAERLKLEESEDKDDKFSSHYPFSESNVKRFAEFCKQSGGFIIC